MTPAEIYREVVALIKSAQTISAIRLLKQHFPLFTLKECMDLVEAIIENLDLKKS